MNKTLMAIIAFFLVGGGAIFWNAMQPAPQGASHSMVPPDTSNLVEGAAIVDVALPAELSAEMYRVSRSECRGSKWRRTAACPQDL